MKLEMEGKEPLFLFFGMPTCTAAIILLSVWLAQPQVIRETVQPSDVKVQAEVTAKLPNGAINVQNTIPPAQIQLVEKEVVKETERLKDVNIRNEFRMPEVRAQIVKEESPVRFSNEKTPMEKVSVPEDSPTEAEKTYGGTILPPPKDAKTVQTKNR